MEEGGGRTRGGTVRSLSNIYHRVYLGAWIRLNNTRVVRRLYPVGFLAEDMIQKQVPSALRWVVRHELDVRILK